MSTLFNHQLVFSGLCDEYHLLKVSLHNTINSGAKMMGIHYSPVFGSVFQEDIPRNNRGVFSICFSGMQPSGRSTLHEFAEP